MAETLTLDERKVLSVRAGFGFRIVRSVLLRNLSGEVVVTKEVDWDGFMVVLFMILLPVLAIYWLAIHIPFSIALAHVLVSLFLAIMIRGAVKALRPSEVTKFMDVDGKMALKIYMPRRRTSEYRDFVSALSERIKR